MTPLVHPDKNPRNFVEMFFGNAKLLHILSNNSTHTLSTLWEALGCEHWKANWTRKSIEYLDVPGRKLGSLASKWEL